MHPNHGTAANPQSEDATQPLRLMDHTLRDGRVNLTVSAGPFPPLHSQIHAFRASRPPYPSYPPQLLDTAAPPPIGSLRNSAGTTPPAPMILAESAQSRPLSQLRGCFMNFYGVSGQEGSSVYAGPQIWSSLAHSHPTKDFIRIRPIPGATPMRNGKAIRDNCQAISCESTEMS